MSVIVDGREWKEYDIEWNDDEGRLFSFSIRALSREHASYILQDIKRTARLGFGEIIGRYENG